jgi:hypothetical protein
MPMFIKMGLGGTGYLGKKESYLRSARKRAARRRIMDGYPITTPFESLEAVREYLSGDKVVCLLCGKAYKKLGVHLHYIHQVSCDEYKERYGLNWRRGLTCGEFHEAMSALVKERIQGWRETGRRIGADDETLKKMRNKDRREVRWQSDIGKENIQKAIAHGRIRPKSKRPHEECSVCKSRGEIHYVGRTHKGTEEFHEKMRKRPQLENTGERMGNYWRGRKQSPEHLRRRIEATKATNLKKKAGGDQ